MSVSIIVDGQEFQGWTAYDVETSLLIPSDAFSLSIGKVSWAMLKQLKPGKSVVVKLLGETILTGQIDELQATQEPSVTRLEIQGRDRMATLIDCSADPLWDWRELTLAEAAKRVLTHYGLGVPVIGTGGAVKRRQRFAVEPGESAWAFLDRYAKQAGVLLWWSADGSLQLATPTATAPALELRLDGTDLTNVLNSSVRVSIAERYSTYRVMGQNGDFASSHKPSATVTDPEITLKRPLVVVDSEAGSVDACTQRATYERERRRAEGMSLEYTIAGHLVNGVMVRIGQTVELYDALLGISGPYLASQVRYSCSNADGHRSRITLRRHEALLAPVPATRKKHEVI